MRCWWPEAEAGSTYHGDTSNTLSVATIPKILVATVKNRVWWWNFSQNIHQHNHTHKKINNLLKHWLSSGLSVSAIPRCLVSWQKRHWRVRAECGPVTTVEDHRSLTTINKGHGEAVAGLPDGGRNLVKVLESTPLTRLLVPWGEVGNSTASIFHWLF